MQKQLFKEGQSVYFEPGWEADIKKMVVDKMIPKEWKDREFIISSVFYDDDEDTWLLACDDWSWRLNQIWFEHPENPHEYPAGLMVGDECTPILD